jgi:hypothetical protein
MTRFYSIVVRDKEMKGKRERRGEKEGFKKERIFGSGHVTRSRRRRGVVVNVAQYATKTAA